MQLCDFKKDLFIQHIYLVATVCEELPQTLGYIDKTDNDPYETYEYIYTKVIANYKGKEQNQVDGESLKGNTEVSKKKGERTNENFLTFLQKL